MEDKNDPDVRKILQILQRILDIGQFCRKSWHIFDVDDSSRIRGNCRLSGTSIFRRVTWLDKTDWSKFITVGKFRNWIWWEFFGNIFCAYNIGFQFAAWNWVAVFVGIFWFCRQIWRNLELRKLSEKRIDIFPVLKFQGLNLFPVSKVKNSLDEFNQTSLDQFQELPKVTSNSYKILCQPQV